MGSQLTLVAVSFQAYGLTHSTLVVGLIGLAQLRAAAGRRPVGRDAGRRHGPPQGADHDPVGHGHRGRRPGGQRLGPPSGGVAPVRLHGGGRRVPGRRLAGEAGRPPHAGGRPGRDRGHRPADHHPTAGPGGRPRPGRHPHRHHRAERRLRHRRGHLRRGPGGRPAPPVPGAGRGRHADGAAVDGRGIPAPQRREAAVGHLLDRPQRHDLRHAPGRLPGPRGRAVRRRRRGGRPAVRRPRGRGPGRLAVHRVVQPGPPSGTGHRRLRGGLGRRPSPCSA